MAGQNLEDAASVIGRFHGTPPMTGGPYLGNTQVAGPWAQQPFSTYSPAVRQHVIAGVFRGDGSTSFKFGGKELSEPSLTGTTIITPKGHDGWWECPGTPVVSNIYLGEERLQLLADEVGRGGRPELLLNLKAEDPTLFKILRLISLESTVGGTLSNLFMEQLIDLLCLQLLRRHVAYPVDIARYRGGLSPAQIKRLTDYMQDRLCVEVRLQELADLAGLSRFHFCRAFRQSTGYTPHQWLVRLRIRRAIQLLSTPELSITNVALAVGYQTPSSFTLAFRSATGFTPTAFRARL